MSCGDPYLIELFKMNSAKRLLVCTARQGLLSQTIYTRASERVRPKCLGTWTDRIKRWSSEGKEGEKSNTKEVIKIGSELLHTSTCSSTTSV